MERGHLVGTGLRREGKGARGGGGLQGSLMSLMPSGKPVWLGGSDDEKQCSGLWACGAEWKRKGGEGRD